MKQLVLGFIISVVALSAGIKIPPNSIFTFIGVAIVACGIIGCFGVICGVIGIYPRRTEIKTKLKGLEQVREDLVNRRLVDTLVVEWNEWLAEKKHERTTDNWIWVPREVEETPFL